MTETILYWRRIDTHGLERMALCFEPDGISAAGSVICLDEGGFRIDHHWRLDRDWRAQWVAVQRWNADGHDLLRLERSASGWTVDGLPRPDLDGAEEPDLSVTPFCNTLAIRRTPMAVGASLALDVAYIDGAAMTVARSRQRYDRQGPDRLRYVDLGLSAGFEVDLLVDADGLVVHYEHLFERIAPPS